MPPGGHVFGLFSSRGIVRNVKLIRSRGIQFLVGGDNFLIHNCTSRQTADDGGGGLRFNRGDGVRGYAMDLETSDDCYQFGAADGDFTTTNGSIVDSVGRTNQGSLCAFILGGDGISDEAPKEGRIANCLFQNIRGSTGGSPGKGGYAIKFNCVNSLNPMENCWAIDIAIEQADGRPAGRAPVHVIVGRGPDAILGTPGSGVVGCGVRNVVIENRTGPLLLVDRFVDDLSTSTMIDFTVDGLTGKGPGTVLGVPLIEAHLGRRLTLRDVTGELANPAGPGSAAPSRALDIAAGTNDRLEELVIDGVAVTDARFDPAYGGLWRFGNIGSIRARRLTVEAADPEGSTGIGGLELVAAGSPPRRGRNGRCSTA